MNKTILLGRLIKDPEVILAKNDSEFTRARYILAVKKKKKNEASFIPCVCFGKNAEFAQKFLRKGKEIIVSGHIDTGSYETNTGNRVFTMNVIVDEHYFTGAPDPAVKEKHAQAGADGFMEIPEGVQEELPFD